jgi:uncharacterized membrane protein
MTRYLIAYLGSAGAMAVLDVIWLRLAVKTLYEPAIGTLLSGQTNVPAAALFYVLYVLGILLFATTPALRGGGVATALVMGGAFGFFTYMTYDLTNMATLRAWPAHLAFIDIAWGTFLTAAAASAGYAAASRFG